PVVGAGAVIVTTEMTAAQQVLGVALFAATFGLGVQVQRRSERAAQAQARAARWEAEEVASRAERIVARERRRLAADSASLLHAATLEMRELALAAERDGDPDTIRRLHDRGKDAVG